MSGHYIAFKKKYYKSTVSSRHFRIKQLIHQPKLFSMLAVINIWYWNTTVSYAKLQYSARLWNIIVFWKFFFTLRHTSFLQLFLYARITRQGPTGKKSHSKGHKTLCPLHTTIITVVGGGGGGKGEENIGILRKLYVGEESEISSLKHSNMRY